MNTITIEPVGEFTEREEFTEQYISKQVAVPFLDNQEIEFHLDYYDDNDNFVDFIADTEKILQKFFQLTVQNRNLISESVWQNCQEFLEAVGYHEEHEALYHIKNADEIWDFVEPSFASVMRDDISGSLFILLFFRCDWEIEHGMQITIREDMIVTAVTMITYGIENEGLEVNLC